MKRLGGMKRLGAGTLLVVLCLAGCGSGGPDTVASSVAGTDECGPEQSAVPIVGKRRSDDGSRIRVAYTNDDPCRFAVSRHRGNLYFSLLSGGDKEVTAVADGVGCVDVPLDPPVPSGTHVYPVGTGKAPAASDLTAALSDDAECLRVPEGKPNFVID